MKGQLYASYQIVIPCKQSARGHYDCYSCTSWIFYREYPSGTTHGRVARVAASPLRPIALWSLLLRYRCSSRLLGRSVFPAGTSVPLDLLGCSKEFGQRLSANIGLLLRKL